MEAKRNLRHVNWYIHPLNAESNQALAKLLASTNGLAECSEIKLANGKTCPAFQLDSYRPISMLKGARDKFGYKYDVYCQQGPYGPIKKWIFS